MSEQGPTSGLRPALAGVVGQEIRQRVVQQLCLELSRLGNEVHFRDAVEKLEMAAFEQASDAADYCKQCCSSAASLRCQLHKDKGLQRASPDSQRDVTQPRLAPTGIAAPARTDRHSHAGMPANQSIAGNSEASHGASGSANDQQGPKQMGKPPDDEANSCHPRRAVRASHPSSTLSRSDAHPSHQMQTPAPVNPVVDGTTRNPAGMLQGVSDAMCTAVPTPSFKPGCASGSLEELPVMQEHSTRSPLEASWEGQPPQARPLVHEAPVSRPGLRPRPILNPSLPSVQEAAATADGKGAAATQDEEDLLRQLLTSLAPTGREGGYTPLELFGPQVQQQQQPGTSNPQTGPNLPVSTSACRSNMGCTTLLPGSDTRHLDAGFMMQGLGTGHTSTGPPGSHHVSSLPTQTYTPQPGMEAAHCGQPGSAVAGCMHLTPGAGLATQLSMTHEAAARPAQAHNPTPHQPGVAGCTEPTCSPRASLCAPAEELQRSQGPADVPISTGTQHGAQLAQDLGNTAGISTGIPATHLQHVCPHRGGGAASVAAPVSGSPPATAPHTGYPAVCPAAQVSEDLPEARQGPAAHQNSGHPCGQLVHDSTYSSRPARFASHIPTQLHSVPAMDVCPRSGPGYPMPYGMPQEPVHNWNRQEAVRSACGSSRFACEPVHPSAGTWPLIDVTTGLHANPDGSQMMPTGLGVASLSTYGAMSSAPGTAAHTYAPNSGAEVWCRTNSSKRSVHRDVLLGTPHVPMSDETRMQPVSYPGGGMRMYAQDTQTGPAKPGHADTCQFPESSEAYVSGAGSWHSHCEVWADGHEQPVKKVRVGHDPFRAPGGGLPDSSHASWSGNPYHSGPTRMHSGRPQLSQSLTRQPGWSSAVLRYPHISAVSAPWQSTDACQAGGLSLGSSLQSPAHYTLTQQSGAPFEFAAPHPGAPVHQGPLQVQWHQQQMVMGPHDQLQPGSSASAGAAGVVPEAGASVGHPPGFACINPGRTAVYDAYQSDCQTTMYAPSTKSHHRPGHQPGQQHQPEPRLSSAGCKAVGGGAGAGADALQQQQHPQGLQGASCLPEPQGDEPWHSLLQTLRE